MKERPILFSAPMVQAILSGNKSQTRRAINPQPLNGWKIEQPPVLGHITSPHPKKGKFGVFIKRDTKPEFPETDIIASPYGKIGDQLWVRETVGIGRASKIAYYRDTLNGRDPKALFDKWTPSIHMPRWASRIQLEITNIRVEPLQDISESDALAEGCRPIEGCKWHTWEEADAGIPMHDHTARDAFSGLWAAINGEDSWSANPWVWVIEFKRVER